MDPIWCCRLTLSVFTQLTMTANAQCEWTVEEDTIPTNVYTSSYLNYRTVQYGAHSPDNQRAVARTQATSRVAH